MTSFCASLSSSTCPLTRGKSSVLAPSICTQSHPEVRPASSTAQKAQREPPPLMPACHAPTGPALTHTPYYTASTPTHLHAELRRVPEDEGEGAQHAGEAGVDAVLAIVELQQHGGACTHACMHACLLVASFGVRCHCDRLIQDSE